MNRDLALSRDDGGWPLERYDPASGMVQRPETRGALDFPTLLRIALEWRWLVLGSTAAGLALAIAYALSTTPMYRAWVMLQVNPPTVQIMEEGSASAEDTTPWDYVAT
ncbi:MAG TPA: Wzz/FepE/Etk N-terminal domain-containing protein, partial [Sphingomicrobium sp.]|nr:Wzz/FepE/Etk N-terminal domain-containing protein [Sphingomicrobium sp.]